MFIVVNKLNYFAVTDDPIQNIEKGDESGVCCFKIVHYTIVQYTLVFFYHTVHFFVQIRLNLFSTVCRTSHLFDDMHA